MSDDALMPKPNMLDLILEDVHEEVLAGQRKHGPYKSLHDAYGRTRGEWIELEEAILLGKPEQCPEKWSHVVEEARQMAAMCCRIILELAPKESIWM